jgi:uncharacterized protein (TIGR02271 family)
MATQRTEGIYPLDELKGHTVAKGNPDPRGWDVYSSDDTKLGEVKDLLVDVSVMEARYLDVELDKDIAGERDRHVLLPVGTARLDDDSDRVIADTAIADVRSLPAYRKGGAIQREFEDSLMGSFGTTRGAGAATGATTGAGANYYDRPEFDTSRFYGNRGTRTERAADFQDARAKEEQRLTLSEEELSLGKRQVPAGEVGIRKTVETEHVEERVPLTHEEVSVERRPISGASARDAEIGEDEIRVPLMAEEPVVEKRVVAKEEVIVNKRAVQDEKTVEADLRRERVDYDESQLNAAAGTRGARETARDASRDVTRDAKSGAKNLGDRIADKVDDVKDRFDANPASKPGRDATDRPGR